MHKNQINHRKKKKQEKNIMKKISIRIPKIFFFLSIISYMLSAYFLLSENGIFTYIKQKKQIEILEKEINKVKENIKQIEYKKKLLESKNREYLENVFRKFGWVKQGEKIIITQEE